MTKGRAEPGLIIRSVARAVAQVTDDGCGDVVILSAADLMCFGARLADLPPCIGGAAMAVLAKLLMKRLH